MSESDVKKERNWSRKIVFSSPWFEVVAEGDGAEPHYVIQGPEFVVVVVVTPRHELLLVRQYRVAARALTLELPAGHIDPGETPEQAARRELLEETGCQAPAFTLLGKLSPSVARFSNHMWCFFAPGAQPVTTPNAQREPGVDLVLYERGIRGLIEEKEFYSAVSYAALLLALARGRLEL